MKQIRKLIAISSLISVVIFISACGAGDVGFTAEAPAAAPAAPAADAPMEQRRVEMVAVEVAEEAEWLFDADDADWAFYGSEEGFLSANLSFASQHMLERMVVRNADLTLETTQFQYVIHEVDRIVARHGGFVEQSNQWLHRSARSNEDFWVALYTLRVPVNSFDTAIRDLTALGYLVEFSTSSEDVTMQFADMESRLQIRLEEERRIMTMIENTEDLGELIRLEARLAELLIAIDAHRRSMTELDMLASFSTILLSVSEVEEEGIVPVYVDGFGGRIAEAFTGSIEFSVLLLEGFAILLASIILPLAIMGLIVFGIFLLVRKAVRPKV